MIKAFCLVLTLSFMLFGCNLGAQKSKVEITFAVVSTDHSKTRDLVIFLKNHSDKDLIVALPVSYRKMFGNDQCTHFNTSDEPILEDFSRLEVNCFTYGGATPFNYSGEIPSVYTNLNLHLKVKSVFAESGKWQRFEETFLYIKDKRRFPNFQFVKAHTTSQIYFTIKDSTKGKYFFSVLSKDDLRKLKPWKRGLDRMQYILWKGVDGFHFFGGEYKVTPLEVEF